MHCQIVTHNRSIKCVTTLIYLKHNYDLKDVCKTDKGTLKFIYKHQFTRGTTDTQTLLVEM